MPRYEGVDHNAAQYKSDIDTAPANLAEEAEWDRANGRPSVGTRGGEIIPASRATAGPNNECR